MGNHHSGSTTAVIVTGKDHQWVLKLATEKLMRNRMFAKPQNISPQEIYKLKRESSNFAVKKPSNHHLNQMIKVNGTNTETYQ